MNAPDIAARVKVRIDGKAYTIAFDEYGEIDTITRQDGKLMVSTSAVARKILRRSESILYCRPVDGLEYV